MSNATLSYVDRRASTAARVMDFIELTKPRIAAMVLVTVAVSASVGSWGHPPLAILFHTLVGTALVAASASAFNQWLERDSDSLMERTSARPIPAGRLSGWEVWLFGALAVTLGTIYLVILVNLLSALLGVMTWFLYVAVYTPLKLRTPANTFIGAVAGALPVLLGWAAVEAPFAPRGPGLSGGLCVAALFLIVYLWQFPHFMAIAWIYRRQYRAAGLKMLTVVDPSGQRAGAQAVWGALALVPVSLLAVVGIASSAGGMGLACFWGSVALGLGYLVASAVFFLQRSDAAARGLLLASLFYLPAQLGLLLLLPLT